MPVCTTTLVLYDSRITFPEWRGYTVVNGCGEEQAVYDSIVGQVLWRAAEDESFRARLLNNLGMGLAEAGFILSDDEMRTLRGQWEQLTGLSDRAAYERVAAMARGYRR